MNQNSHPQSHNFPFNDMESYNIENNMKNKNFVNEKNIHPTLSIF